LYDQEFLHRAKVGAFAGTSSALFVPDLADPLVEIIVYINDSIGVDGEVDGQIKTGPIAVAVGRSAQRQPGDVADVAGRKLMRRRLAIMNG
jgi:hypothetical protein